MRPARRWRRRRIAGAVAVAAALCSAACTGPARPDDGAARVITVTGAAMGTTFAVTVVADAADAAVTAGGVSSGGAPAEAGRPGDVPSGDVPLREAPSGTAPPGMAPGVAPAGQGAPGRPDRAAVEAAVRGPLERVERRMSRYREDSDLSRFNRARTTAPQRVSRDTLVVVAAAQAVSRASGGAFDVTAAPLIDAWGFGPAGPAAAAPDPAAIEALRGRVGAALLEVDPAASTVRKRRPDVAIDLNAIAKGYAVDAVAEALQALGVRDALVEVGGDVRAMGRNAAGAPWRVGIERPDPGPPAVRRVVGLTGAAIATSGDYRNVYDLDGVRVGHTLDPRTGRPVTHRLRSVSVVAARAMPADARATALAVLGPDDGYALAVDRGWAALFLVADDGGAVVERETPAFAAAVR